MAALRSLFRSPGLFATAAVLLALGIGATTALFSVVNTVLLAPLPYEQPDRLVRIWSESTARNLAHLPESPTNLNDFHQEATLFEGIAGVNTGNAILERPGGEPRQLLTANGTWNLLAVLGVRPQLGRDFNEYDGAFSATDVAPGAQFPGTTFAIPRVTIISDALWHGAFGGRPDVIGSLIQVNGNALEVVGVLPRDFRLLMGSAAGVAPDVDLVVPLRVDHANAVRNNLFLNMVGRLKPGVTVEQGGAEVHAIGERIFDANPVMRAGGMRKHTASHGKELIGDVRGTIWALLGAAAFVLLIACANVANLLLVRAAGRAREMSVRGALGAGRGRIVMQMLGEAAVLAAVGAAGGLLLAQLGLAVVLETAPANIARLDQVSIDFSVFTFALGAALFTTVGAGIVPALHASRADVAGALRDRSGGGLGGGKRVLCALAVGEIALSFVLLVGTGLMVRSLHTLHTTDLGFDAQDILTFQVNIPFQRFPQFAERRDMIYAFEERLAALPGVTGATATVPLPFAAQQRHGRYTTEQPSGEDTAYRQAYYRTVLPGFFEATGATLLSGRTLTRDDEINARQVVVVDDTFAELSWPDEDPVGRQIWLRIGNPDPVPLEVVGVIRRQLQANLHESPREAVYYTAGTSGQFVVNSWMVRSTLPQEALLPLVRRELAAIDAEIPVVQARPLSDLLDGAMARQLFALQLIGAFGLSALLIAAVGLYAAIHFVVRQRRGEIGVRMSFGARSRDIFAQFLRHGVVLATVGISVGLAAAFALTRTLSGLLVGVSPTDPATYAAIAAVFAAIALVACALPAWRASQVDPIAVLRSE